MPDATILIVEDEILVARDLELRLTAAGYRVAEITHRGDEAVALVERFRPDLVLMDISLKGPLDGVQAAQAIRDRVPTPVVFLTAHADEATLSRARAVAPLRYVCKPFCESELLAAVADALRGG